MQLDWNVHLLAPLLYERLVGNGFVPPQSIVDMRRNDRLSNAVEAGREGHGIPTSTHPNDDGAVSRNAMLFEPSID